ncbi:MAG: hypothetical protein JKY32_07825 [Rhizobiales bacterium]|nr:hypothetical protein [Hyphomicrobiales bacterium]
MAVKCGLPQALKDAGSLDQLKSAPDELLEAMAVTFRGKAKVYGDYVAGMATFAGLVSARLKIDVTPSQAAGIMSDLKQSRLLHDPGHRDSAHDKIVYEAMCLALKMAEGRA